MFTKMLPNVFGIRIRREKELKAAKDIESNILYFLEKYSGNWNSVREHPVIQFFESGPHAVQHFVLFTSMI